MLVQNAVIHTHETWWINKHLNHHIINYHLLTSLSPYFVFLTSFTKLNGLTGWFHLKNFHNVVTVSTAQYMSLLVDLKINAQCSRWQNWANSTFWQPYVLCSDSISLLWSVPTFDCDYLATTFCDRLLGVFFRELLKNLKATEGDVEQIAGCFMDRVSQFDAYSEYCTKYHKYVPVYSFRFQLSIYLWRPVINWCFLIL